MPDFWRNSGYHLLDRDPQARLRVTDDFLRAYLLRPEIRPVAESGPAEIALHEALMENPRHPVSEEELAAIEDPDACDNYRVLLAFFERLMRAESLEACYAALFREPVVPAPPLFVDQLAQIIMRGVLEGCEDALEARAAELFYREQRVSLEGGLVLLADKETLEARAARAAPGALAQLIAQAQGAFGATAVEVLDTANAADYWGRSERHDFAFAIGYGRAGNLAFCRVVEKWVRHFFGVEVRVRPLRAIERDWAWHVGLDAESTALLNDLWRGEEVEAGRMHRLLALFQLDFTDPAAMQAEVAGEPVYLGLSMDPSGVVKMKPQNLLLNLPLAAPV